MLKVVTMQSLILASDVMENCADFYALCSSRHAKFKLKILGQHMSPIAHRAQGMATYVARSVQWKDMMSQIAC